jgi:hypothetical protein
MTFTRHLINESHVHDFIITPDARGWDVREEEDSSVLRRAHHDDWHRVERETLLFNLRALALKANGWIER